MGKDLADEFAEARAVFDEVDETLNLKLSSLCFEGPADELTLTHNAQPALLAHGAAAWRVLKTVLAPHVRAAAGHSLGEHTAYHAAGSTTLPEAARLVRRRGQLMYDEGINRPGAMAAILGLDADTVALACVEASQGEVVSPANFNAPGQIVIAGHKGAVERAMELAKAAAKGKDIRLGGGVETVREYLKAGLVDEIYTFVGNIIIGGRDAPTPADGSGFIKESEFPRLTLIEARRIENGILLHWKVAGPEGQ